MGYGIAQRGEARRRPAWQGKVINLCSTLSVFGLTERRMAWRRKALRRKAPQGKVLSFNCYVAWYRVVRRCNAMRGPARRCKARISSFVFQSLVAGRCAASLSLAAYGNARQGINLQVLVNVALRRRALRGRALQGKARTSIFDFSKHGDARRTLASPGNAKHRKALQGKVSIFFTLSFIVWPGEAWLGDAGQSVVRLGKGIHHRR